MIRLLAVTRGTVCSSEEVKVDTSVEYDCQEAATGAWATVFTWIRRVTCTWFILWAIATIVVCAWFR